MADECKRAFQIREKKSLDKGAMYLSASSVVLCFPREQDSGCILIWHMEQLAATRDRQQHPLRERLQVHLR